MPSIKVVKSIKTVVVQVPTKPIPVATELIKFINSNNPASTFANLIK